MSDILFDHKSTNSPFSTCLDASDEKTEHDVPHRCLSHNGHEAEFSETMLPALKKHHTSDECAQIRAEIVKTMNAKAAMAVRNASPYPHNERTCKGNYAEVFLAEYLDGATSSSLPVYRLRYNPNPEQAMKGDDVLLFDLDSDPIRIIVGEAKFREVPNKQAVVDMIDALMRSHRAGLPASVVFVAQRLITEGNIDMGIKVMSCLSLFAAAKLRIDYKLFLRHGNDACYLMSSDGTLYEEVASTDELPFESIANIPGLHFKHTKDVWILASRNPFIRIMEV